MKLLDKINNKNTIIILLIFMIVGITLIFTQYFGFFPLDEKYALDMLNYYNKTQFFNNIVSMDSSSRLSYFMIHVGDYLYMFGFYQLLGVIIYKLIKDKSILIYLVIFPYLAFLFDLLENIIMDIHLAIYPNQIQILGYIPGVCTFLKFTTLYLSITILVVGLIYKLINKYRKMDNG